MSTNTVRSLLALIGVNDTTLFNSQTQAERLSNEMFDDSFESCLDKTHEEIDADLKIYSALTTAQGRIIIGPGIKRRIKAFVQWTKDMIRTDRDPSTELVTTFDVAGLMRRYKTHLSFTKKSATLTTTANPTQFSKETKWEDWEPTFRNFLRTIPGRDGVPLDYIIRANVAPIRGPNADMLTEYVNQAPLNGPAFQTDAAEVHTYLAKFIAGNSVAEAKVQANIDQKNGRIDFISLRDHYEGVGVNAVDIIKADNTLESLFYSGEKKPHMWWDLFEQNLTSAFTTYEKKENRPVHSNEMKLRTLIKKVNADFLQTIKASIKVEMTNTPMTMTYERALANFRNEVNNKFPSDGATGRTRRIREANTSNRSGRGRGRSGRGNGRGGRGRGRGNNGDNKAQKRKQTIKITLTDGTEIDYHPSFKFDDDVFRKFKQEDKQRLFDDRARYKRMKLQSTSSMPSDGNNNMFNPYTGYYGNYNNMNYPPMGNNTYHINQASTSPPLPPPPSNPPPVSPPPPPSGPTSSSYPGSIMGGRNSQAGARHFQGGRPS